ncbi:hypothetical protein SAMN05421595_2784 [Austwickia chelonae]|uniref:Uncharacterized protein n=1 Tax=Austwickia chelonae NBRC 105200 TaxID=1184607 RepID=K6W9M5_9MICO|nr:hypothetical protein [Austwickia chelonae]GAB78512.1 hypothetical protein AUCHE_09_01170 [Austwickia chelonae NBRC 105200]SEW40278.1 hypothetical protein SAMN05421595_2784 [Austwickia chelonae]
MNDTDELHRHFHPHDRPWMNHAKKTLENHHVAPTHIRKALLHAGHTCRHTGQTAEDTHGPAEEWAQNRIHDWQQEGHDVWTTPPELTLRFRILSGLGGATGTALAPLLRHIINRDDTPTDITATTLLGPPAVAIAFIATTTLYHRTLRRHSAPAALGAATTAIILFIAGALAVRTTLQWPTLWTANWTHHAAATALYGLLTLAVALTWQTPNPTPTPPHPDQPTPQDQEWRKDQNWLDTFAQSLRRQNHLPEKKIRAHLEETRAHTAASGRTLVEEFGPPRAYAATLPSDQTRQAGLRLTRHSLYLAAFSTPVIVQHLTDRPDLPLHLKIAATLAALLFLSSLAAYLGTRQQKRTPPGRTPSDAH